MLFLCLLSLLQGFILLAMIAYGWLGLLSLTGAVIVYPCYIITKREGLGFDDKMGSQRMEKALARYVEGVKQRREKR